MSSVSEALIGQVLIPAKSPKTKDLVLLNTGGSEVRHDYRDGMLSQAYSNGQVVRVSDSGRYIRMDWGSDPNIDWDAVSEIKQSYESNKAITRMNEEIQEKMANDPVLQLLAKANELKPNDLVMQVTKWKFLMRSVLREKNIMMLGPSGCGKTVSARAVAKALERPFFKFNLGASQDPRSFLIGNTHFRDGQTIFEPSEFAKAIQTENAIILLDELSRAHPDAHNILMTVLDEEQRYMRLDEAHDSPTIEVASGVSFIATANVGVEYSATRVIDRAITDRFEIIEVDILNAKEEADLLKVKFPELKDNVATAIGKVAHHTRKLWGGESQELSTMMSTRSSVRVAELMIDGFNFEEAGEVAILPLFDSAGGTDSERTKVLKMLQAYIGLSNVSDLFEKQQATKKPADKEEPDNGNPFGKFFNKDN